MKQIWILLLGFACQVTCQTCSRVKEAFKNQSCCENITQDFDPHPLLSSCQPLVEEICSLDSNGLPRTCYVDNEDQVVEVQKTQFLEPLSDVQQVAFWEDQAFWTAYPYESSNHRCGDGTKVVMRGLSKDFRFKFYIVVYDSHELHTHCYIKDFMIGGFFGPVHTTQVFNDRVYVPGENFVYEVGSDTPEVRRKIIENSTFSEALRIVQPFGFDPSFFIYTIDRKQIMSKINVSELVPDTDATVFHTAFPERLARTYASTSFPFQDSKVFEAWNLGFAVLANAFGIGFVTNTWTQDLTLGGFDPFMTIFHTVLVFSQLPQVPPGVPLLRGKTQAVFRASIRDLNCKVLNAGQLGSRSYSELL